MKRISILTNFQAPYRESLFSELARLSDVQVYYLFRGDSVRHFNWRPSNSYSSQVLMARSPFSRWAAKRSFDTELGVVGPSTGAAIAQDANLLLVLGWEQPAYMLTLLIAFTRGIPYAIYTESILSTHRFVERGLVSRIRRLIFQKASLVWVPSEGARQAVLGDGVRPQRILQTANSIDVDFFRTEVRDRRADRTPNSGPHRFLYVGQLIERKNVSALISAVSILDEDICLEVVGDGPNRDALEAQAGNMVDFGRVRFHGFKTGDQLLELYSFSSTLVLPSLEEVYGMTAHEGYEAGLQVIVSDCAGVSSSLGGREGVWVVPPVRDEIVRAMRASIKAWHGWRDEESSQLGSIRDIAEQFTRKVSEILDADTL